MRRLLAQPAPILAVHMTGSRAAAEVASAPASHEASAQAAGAPRRNFDIDASCSVASAAGPGQEGDEDGEAAGRRAAAREIPLQRSWCSLGGYVDKAMEDRWVFRDLDFSAPCFV